MSFGRLRRRRPIRRLSGSEGLDEASGGPAADTHHGAAACTGEDEEAAGVVYFFDGSAFGLVLGEVVLVGAFDQEQGVPVDANGVGDDEFGVFHITRAGVFV